MRGKPCPPVSQMRSELHTASGGSENNYWRDRATDEAVVAEYVRLDGCILGAINGDGGDIVKQITDFIKENTLLVGGALVLILLLKRK